MEIIRGTTPTIVITITNEMDLTLVQEVWVYISQQKKVKIDKQIDDVTIDAENNKITVKLSQNDTLNLKANQDTLFQIRMLLDDDTAIATIAENISVEEIYKEGVIE